MRIAWWLFCFYGLLFPAAHAATLIDLRGSSCAGSPSIGSTDGLSFSCSGDFSLSTGRLSSDTSISVTSLGSLLLDAITLSAPSITLNAASIHIGLNSILSGQNINLSANDLSGNGINMTLDRPLILSRSPLDLLPRPFDITLGIVPSSSLSAGSISLLPGGNINLISSANRDPISGVLIPQISGGDISINRAGSIDAGRGSLSAKDVTILPGGNISLTPINGEGIISAGEVGIVSGKNIAIIPGTAPLAHITSVPLPASFTLLLTGLLALLSLSGHSLTRKNS